MKEKMWKYFSANSTNVYINVLPDLVKEYNNTRHSSIKMTPVKASKKENELTVWRNLYPEQQILESSKLKEFADDNSQFDENDVKFSKRIENTVG